MRAEALEKSWSFRVEKDQMHQFFDLMMSEHSHDLRLFEELSKRVDEIETEIRKLKIGQVGET